MNAILKSVVFVLLTLARQGISAPLTDRELVTPSSTSAPGFGVKDLNGAENYLTKYGYLSSPISSARRLVASDAVERAIIKFQEYFKLNKTGELDNETLSVMNSQRCSLPDIVADENGRRKRYALKKRWHDNHLKYKVTNLPNWKIGFAYDSDFYEAVEKSFKVWTGRADLKIVKSEDYAEMVIGFYSGSHSNCQPFDGPGSVLGHAYYPDDGRIHLDDDETWSEFVNAPTGGQYMPRVLGHQIGHALGLMHTSDPDALMYPRFSNEEVALGEDDIRGIRSLYGSNKGSDNRPNHPITFLLISVILYFILHITD